MDEPRKIENLIAHKREHEFDYLVAAWAEHNEAKDVEWWSE